MPELIADLEVSVKDEILMTGVDPSEKHLEGAKVSQ